MRQRAIELIALFALFVGLNWLLYRHSPGDDLSSGYMACQLIARGLTASVYAHDAQLFHVVTDPNWLEAARQSGFTGFLHPYVQTPLWALALQPLCTEMSFSAFNALFSLVALGALALCVWLAFCHLTPSPVAPRTVAVALAWLSLSLPFIYGMQLTQTHALFLLASLAALLWAERGHEASAGLLLAMAAAVKITPALLVLYWLAARRWRAVAAFMGASAILACLTWRLAGTALMLAYVASMRRVSDVLLVSYNNHSLAALLMAPHYPQELHNWRMLPLPRALKYALLGMAAALTLYAGWMRRRGGNEAATVSIALLAMTMFAPIAWSHYYIVLIVPMVWLMCTPGLRWAAWVVGLAACVPHGPVRTLLFAAMACILVCIGHLVGARRRPYP